MAGAKHWKVIQSVELDASAAKVWDFIGGFYTIHTWSPGIDTTTVVPDQTKIRPIRRIVNFPQIPAPMNTSTEQLVFMDNENMLYKYKWHAGEWGEDFKDYHSEIQVVELAPDKRCMVFWSGEFINEKDGLTAFYRSGLDFLKEKFG
jgi:hypothetical protein